MMNELLKTVVAQSGTASDGGANGPVLYTTTGDKFIFTAVAPIRLLKWGFLTTAVAVAQTSSAMAFKLSKRVTAGTDTGRVDIDTLTTVASSSYALAFGAYRDGFTVSTKSTTKDEPTGFGPIGVNAPDQESGQAQFTLSVGQQWVINVTTASDNTGQGKVFIEYVLLPISRPSGYGTTDAGTVSLTENYTRLAS